MILSVCANPSVDSFWSFNSITKGTTNRSVGESFYPGGKGIHVAFALSELKKQVATLGVWGGQTGHWLKKQCHQNNIDALGPHVNGWTRICITNQSKTEWNETEFLGGGPSLDKQHIQEFKTTFQQCLSDSRFEAITISGSVPKGFTNNIYSHLVQEAQAVDLPVFIDASGSLLSETLPAHPYAIHINRYEGKELCGNEDPVIIAQWLSDYCSIAAVTAGADGLYLLYDKELLHAWCPIDASDIHSTIGAGDCLLAGLCYSTLNHDSASKWATLATACGSANCIHPDLGMLSIRDVKKLTENVEIERLSFHG